MSVSWSLETEVSYKTEGLRENNLKTVKRNLISWVLRLWGKTYETPINNNISNNSINIIVWILIEEGGD